MWRFRVFPDFIRNRIGDRPYLLRILSNTGWLFFDKILRMGVGLLVGVWFARYLGPGQFGLFNYAVAIIALFTAVATLGLNSIVVRDLVKYPEETNVLLGTTFLVQLIGGGIACIAAILTVWFLRSDNVVFMVAILGLAMVFKSTDAVRYWFECKVLSKYVVWVDNAAFLFFAVVKIVLILCSAPLMAFVWNTLAETVFASILLLVVYRFQGNRIMAWRCKLFQAKSLLRNSWPMILSGLAVMVYMRIDQIMLGSMLGGESVGIYSAALRLSEVWYFIPISIVSSVFPAIVKARTKNPHLYNERFRQLFTLMVILGVAVALPITFCSDWLVTLLYGKGFSASAQVLVAHVWTGPFVFLGVAGGRWFIAENLQKYSFYRTFAGCVVNVVLNALLIPVYGPVGAAVASVLAQAVASVFFNALNPVTRPLFYMQLDSMLGRYLVKS